MKNYKLSLIFGIAAVITAFFHVYLIGPGFAIAAIVIGLEEYKKAKVEFKEIQLKVQTGEAQPEDMLLFDKTTKNYAMGGISLGIISFVIQVFFIISAFLSMFLTNQMIDNIRLFNFFF